MKRILFILFLAFIFNFTSPGTVLLEQRLRHVIEYSQENNSRSENENELIRKKIILYGRILMLQIRMEQINSNNFAFNSS